MSGEPDRSREPRAVAARLVGLAGFHLRSERLDEARNCLDASRGLDPAAFRLHVGLARLAILRGDVATAVAALESARELDPFDEDVLDLLGQLQVRRGDHVKAAECFADAQVTCGVVDAERARGYGRELERAFEAAAIPPGALRTKFLAGRAQYLESLADEARVAGDVLAAVGGHESSEAEEPLLAGSLFGELSPTETGLLESMVQSVHLPAGAAIFREGQPSEDLYVVRRGRIVIQRQTPFGTQVLASVGPGGLFGEMNFIDGLTRSADAVAAVETDLVRLPHVALRRAFDQSPHVAQVFLRQLWHGLASKVREANEIMKTFFSEEVRQARDEPERRESSAGRHAGLAPQAKAGVLDEKGLTNDELKVLAAIAEAGTYDTDQVIFEEGDPGDALYIVFEGKVRIVKHIPGVGDEALAILERGDFFGEMAVIDRSPRSATAIAHLPGTTVLWVDKMAIDGLLSRDSDSARELLLILCRLLSTRLREINDKVVQWKMMSGGF